MRLVPQTHRIRCAAGSEPIREPRHNILVLRITAFIFCIVFQHLAGPLGKLKKIESPGCAIFHTAIAWLCAKIRTNTSARQKACWSA
jgi:hypothetical protein